MRKIVINKCYGGFGLSKKAVQVLAEKGVIKGVKLTKYYSKLSMEKAMKEFVADAKIMELILYEGKVYSCGRGDISRDNPELVKVVETLGNDASGRHADLKVVEIPDDIIWNVEEYDGIEWIAEGHRTWR